MKRWFRKVRTLPGEQKPVTAEASCAYAVLGEYQRMNAVSLRYCDQPREPGEPFCRQHRQQLAHQVWQGHLIAFVRTALQACQRARELRTLWIDQINAIPEQHRPALWALDAAIKRLDTFRTGCTSDEIGPAVVEALFASPEILNALMPHLPQYLPHPENH